VIGDHFDTTLCRCHQAVLLFIMKIVHKVYSIEKKHKNVHQPSTGKNKINDMRSVSLRKA